MPLVSIGENGRFIFHDPIKALRAWLTRPWGNCVVCGGRTRTQLANGVKGRFEFVHNTDESDYLGCKEVWRYWQHKYGMETREQWRMRNHEELLCGQVYEGDYSDDDFLDERDFYDDYHSYIRSREWEIKATSAKCSAGWRCEECSRSGNRTTLHAHHKTYKRLYNEQKRDIQVLCDPCHKREHGRL